MKKRIITFTALLLILALLAGCGGNAASSEPASEPAEPTEEVIPEESQEEAAEAPEEPEEASAVEEEPEEPYVDEGPFDQPEVLSVKAIGFVDVEGPKLRAVAVEYGVDLAGSELDETTYELSGYFKDSVAAAWNNGDGQVGDVTKVYINDRPNLDETGKDSGRFAIIEVYTDYVGASEIPMMSDALATLTVSVT